MPARLALIEKLNMLPVGRLAEVEDFVDSCMRASRTAG